MNSLSPRPLQRAASPLAAVLVIALAAAPISAQSSVQYLPSSQTVSGVSADGTAIFGGVSTQDGFHAFVRKDGVFTTLSLGGASTFPSGASSNGSVVVGSGEVEGGAFQAFVWRAGDAAPTLLAPESLSSNANAVSADGTTIVGTENSDLGTTGFVVRNGVKLSLDFGGGVTIPYAVSGDGTTVVGAAILPGDPNLQAFLWRFGDLDATPVPLGLALPGLDSFSEAVNVSADGSTVSGWRFDAGIPTAFAWNTAQPLASFVSIGGAASAPGGISANGGTAVGQALDDIGLPRGFALRNGLVETLLPPAGRQYSTASFVSADGSRIVGFAWNDPTDTADFDGMDVVVWDAGQPPRFLKDVLTATGATVGPPRLRQALGVSSDARTFVGESFLRTALPSGDFDDVFGSFVAVHSDAPAPPPADPGELILNLMTKVKRSSVPVLVKISLLTKLSVAYLAVKLNIPVLAKVAVNAFIHEVDAQSPRRIPAALADQWIADAEDILDAL